VTAYGLRHTLFSTSLKQVYHCSHGRLLFLLCVIPQRESRPPLLMVTDDVFIADRSC
jgi:hypothetical protein